MATDTVDHVVVGAGINGMVAAARLAGAGRSVVLVDGADALGGFIGSGERTVPGYVHDTWSSWHPLFVTGPAYAGLGADLHRHGLEYAVGDGPLTATVPDDGPPVVAYRDVEETVTAFADPADAEAYRTMIAGFGRDVGSLGALLSSELRSPAVVKPLVTLLRSAGRRGVARYARDAVTSGRSWLRTHFTGPETDRLWAPWLLHAGLAPDAASGGAMVPVFAATMHGAGLPVVVGGAGRFVDAFARLLAERGVDVRLGHRVERVVVRRGRAAGVAGDGFAIRASSVLAGVTPGALYTELLPAGVVPRAVLADARAYRPGRAAMLVHVALSGRVPWRDPALRAVPLVHLSDGSSSTGIACAEAEAGLLPRRPTVVVGQQHVLDPSRVPPGTAALWLQLQEVPSRPVGDAAGAIDVGAGAWTPELAAAHAGRALDRVAAHAPGLRELVVGTDVISPADLEARNPNAIGGDPYAGSAELDQNFAWRPLPSAGRHRTGVPGLWHLGASTHPGPGLGGASGFLVADALLRRRR
ncbi:phytoene desaturase family protein [Actinomycetospora straminea]|uniref:Pyridine nucleotide-disulfide oxidoreductase domain-containing protein 2 n=1 Tax=Actinomycetospora straminea TaxID=663607 RepID=A0ABP9EML1_9PSEU|nr:NAD(P)/FAD-dependent oxidoreductase [Actinomycetospora straminea]MDD7933289.1 NAD(P)/FAD-dependent oxidoreductase [Actinomycetospora straminea]